MKTMHLVGLLLLNSLVHAAPSPSPGAAAASPSPLASPESAPSPTASPSASPLELQSSMDALVDVTLAELAQEQEKGLHPVRLALDPFESISPTGRVVSGYAEDNPEGLRWRILLHDKDHKPEAYFDFVRAQSLEELHWSDDGTYLALKARQGSFPGDPGLLVVLAVERGIAQEIDPAVTSYLMSPDGRHLVFVRLKDPDRPHGDRELVLFDGMSGARVSLTEVKFPTTQIEKIGPWDKSRGECAVSVVDYSGGITHPRRQTGTIDTTAGRLTLR